MWVLITIFKENLAKKSYKISTIEVLARAIIMNLNTKKDWATF